PGAERAAAQVRAALELAGGRAVPVLLASSRTGAGLAELVALLQSFPKRDRTSNDIAELQQAMQREIIARLGRPEANAIAAAWRAGQISTEAALRRFVADVPRSTEDEFRLDIGRADKGRTFVRVVHIASGKERIQVGLGADDAQEVGKRLTAELKAELGL